MSVHMVESPPSVLRLLNAIAVEHMAHPVSFQLQQFAAHGGYRVGTATLPLLLDYCCITMGHMASNNQNFITDIGSLTMGGNGQTALQIVNASITHVQPASIPPSSLAQKHHTVAQPSGPWFLLYVYPESILVGIVMI